MSRNKDLEAGLKALADDHHLPGGGRKKLSRLVADHMDWFEAAEKRGMGWRDMSKALSAVGVTSKRGKPLSIGTLSSTVWRNRAAIEQKSEGYSRVEQSSYSRDLASGSKPSRRMSEEPKVFSQLRAAPNAKKPGNGQTAARVPSKFGHAGPKASPVPATNSAKPSNKDVLDFMNRAKISRTRSRND